MMRRIPLFAAAIVTAAAVLSFAAAPPAEAQSNRTFVSGAGADTGNCAVTAPCRSFAYAITQTANAGEIVVLSSAGYGAFTIIGSLTITNPGGVEAGISATSGDAIDIAGTSPVNITLRGLTLEGLGSGSNGIKFTTALGATSKNQLTLIDCVIKDFAGNGIELAPSETGLLFATIADSLIQNNASIGVSSSANNAKIASTIFRSIITGNGTGLDYETADGSNQAVISASDLNGNLAIGIEIGGTGTDLTIKNSTIMKTAGGTSNIDVDNNGSLDLLNNNAIGLLNNTMAVFSDGTNFIGRTTGGGTITPITLQ